MKDHLVKENIKCLYCGHEPEKEEWFSEWNEEHHYKTFLCDCCKRKNFVRVYFHGSGHDSWEPLEKRV